MNHLTALQQRLHRSVEGCDVTERAVASSLLTLALGLVVLTSAPAMWPLLGLAVVLSARFGGGEGLAASSGTSALVLALLTSHPGVDGGACAVGFLAFTVAGVLAYSGDPSAGAALDPRGADSELPNLLTGAAFRATLGLECRRADRHGHPLELVILDIDHLARVNAKRGRLAGDAVVAAVSRAIVEASRETDIAGHLGADRFAVIVSGAPQDGVEAAERIRAAAAEHLDEAGSVTLSAGVAAHMQRLRSADLMIDAEDALSLAKAEGRDRVREAARGSLLRRAA